MDAMLTKKADELAGQAGTWDGLYGIIQSLMKTAIETMLNSEMSVHLWARGYFVATSGVVTDEVIMEYIRQQEGTEPKDGGDDFRVTKS